MDKETACLDGVTLFTKPHGPALVGETFVHASHLPDGGDVLLYPTITPVNTFRIVLKHYFNADLPLLEDKSFYSTYDRPFRFFDVTNRIR